jgi:hypothetical protein
MNTLKAAHRRFLSFQAKTREPGLTALLVIEVLLIFVVVPLVGIKAIPFVVVPAMFVLLVAAVLVVTSRSYWISALVVIAVVLTPFGTIVQADDPSSVPEWLSTSGRLLGLAALSWVIFGAVFASGRITLHRVQGAIVLYLNFALFFAVLYRLVDILAPDAFHRVAAGGEPHGVWSEMLYFSFTTLTTAGFGDITPVNPFARSLANFESVIGQLYPATLLARLVSLELEHRRQSKS